MAIRVTLDGQKPPHKTRPRARTGLVPAAARPATKLTAQELVLSGDAIDTFTAACGGRGQLLATLSIADDAPATTEVVDKLLDPHYASWSLRRICTSAGITVAELFAHYKKARFAQAHVEATHIIAARLPPIVEDVMSRAVPYAMTCPRCLGAPTTPGTTACPVCQGTGEVLSEPDIDRQKLALELGRLVNQHKGGVLVQQNVNAAAAAALTATSTGSLEQLQQVVGDLLFAPGRKRAAAPTGVIEAKVIGRRDRPDQHVVGAGPDPGQDTP